MLLDPGISHFRRTLRFLASANSSRWQNTASKLAHSHNFITYTKIQTKSDLRAIVLSVYLRIRKKQKNKTKTEAHLKAVMANALYLPLLLVLCTCTIHLQGRHLISELNLGPDNSELLQTSSSDLGSSTRVLHVQEVEAEVSMI